MANQNVGFLNRAEKNNEGSIESAPFSIIDARAIVQRYRDSTRVSTGQERQPIEMKITDGRPADGFYFKYEKGLKELLDTPNLKGFYLAVGEYSNGGKTLVLYGVTEDEVSHNGKENQLHLLLEDGKIYDLIDPCPEKCPVNLGLSNE